MLRKITQNEEQFCSLLGTAPGCVMDGDGISPVLVEKWLRHRFGCEVPDGVSILDFMESHGLKEAAGLIQIESAICNMREAARLAQEGYCSEIKQRCSNRERLRKPDHPDAERPKRERPPAGANLWEARTRAQVEAGNPTPTNP